jgi:hypothetical protein
MNISGKIYQILPLQSGVGRSGEWRKQEVIVETDEQYPKKVCISFWGDKINPNFAAGEKLTIAVNIESREYNGKWYTDVRAWNVEQYSKANAEAVEVAETAPLPEVPPPFVETLPNEVNSFDEGDDGTGLPF